MKAMISLLFALLAGCAHTGHPPLPSKSAASLTDLHENAESLGALVYRGRVAPLGPNADALFYYQRRVVESGDGLRSSHLTMRPDGEVVLLQEAEHTMSYDLRSFAEIHSQTGVVGHLGVDPDQTATFEVTVGGRRRSRIEKGRDPVQVGPTLFGFALAHWDVLTAGESVPVRFAVVADLKTYRFALRVVESDATTTVISMRATSPFVRLAVPAMRLVFDTKTRRIIRFEGRVPPRVGPPEHDRPFDARVDYEMVAERYQ